MKKESKGLGDQIEKFTEATGIKKLVEWAFGEDCGCDKRKEKLNKLFPRRREPQCLNEQEYNYLKEIQLEEFNKSTRLSPKTQKQILDIYNRVFSKRQHVSSCNSCVITMINEMQTLMKSYGN
tara:strand:+ start:91 stop:459 length:369 start_codon:yes stop_codon:yes gene_type:complete